MRSLLLKIGVVAFSGSLLVGYVGYRAGWFQPVDNSDAILPSSKLRPISMDVIPAGSSDTNSKRNVSIGSEAAVSDIFSSSKSGDIFSSSKSGFIFDQPASSGEPEGGAVLPGSKSLILVEPINRTAPAAEREPPLALEAVERHLYSPKSAPIFPAPKKSVSAEAADEGGNVK